MNQRHKRHHSISRLQKKFKNLATAIAGAAVLTGILLPGMAPATAHASADPSKSEQAAVTKQTKEKNSSHPADTSALSDHNNKQDTKDKQDKTSATNSGNYKEVLDITATAYAPGSHDNDQWGDKTFTGTRIRPGVVAVDPKVIPLGSRLYIEYPNGNGEYAKAEDTGGAIKGNRIDIAKSSVEKAQDFGMKDVKVYVLEKGEQEA